MPASPSSPPKDSNAVPEKSSVWEIVAQPGVYLSLERIARQYRRGENALSWWTGDLANETLIRMTNQRNLPPKDDRVAFEKAFAANIQKVLTDKYRTKSAKKRGGSGIRRRVIDMLGIAATGSDHDPDLTALVEHYIQTRPLHAVVIWMAVEFELSVEQIANILNRKPDTIRRKLLMAQAELRDELEPRDDRR